MASGAGAGGFTGGATVSPASPCCQWENNPPVPAAPTRALASRPLRPKAAPMAHSVEGHLRLKIAEYDRRIRTLVFGYDAMRAVQLELLGRYLPRDTARNAPSGRVL